MPDGRVNACRPRPRWELPPRGGLDGARYAWGNEEIVDGKYHANRWTGDFPYHNTAADGFVGTSPVGSFPANGYGLYAWGAMCGTVLRYLSRRGIRRTLQ